MCCGIKDSVNTLLHHFVSVFSCKYIEFNCKAKEYHNKK